MIFVTYMNKNTVLYFTKIGMCLFLTSILLVACKGKKNTSKQVKVLLRNIGHELLLSNNDISSLVMPIKELENATFQVSFQNKLSIEPDSLVTIVNRNLEVYKFSKNYILEVKNCINEEVVYSYQVKKTEENAIIPCKERTLPKDCYTINIQFLNEDISNNYLSVIITSLLIIMLILLLGLYKKKERAGVSKIVNDTSIVLGSFKFYPEQNKLVKQAEEISLSKKECELLSIFIGKPNQIIKREELTKKVWEDNGVIVGRSLDTYISKLRKKLKEDTSIKITNVHGVGYKLELD